MACDFNISFFSFSVIVYYKAKVDEKDEFKVDWKLIE